MTTWRYAVTRRYVEGATDDLSGHVYEIREVYTDQDGKLSWTKDPIDPFGETLKEIQECLARMSSASLGHVLDLTTDPPQRVDPITIRRRDRHADA